MEKIAIITDSSCDLTDQFLEEHHVGMLPLKIIYKEKEYRDRVEISCQEIYDRLSTEVPTTSLPSPSDVESMLNRLADEGFTHIIGVFISSGLSGTFNMVRQVADDFKRSTIELIDSKSLSLGLGFAVLDGVKAIEAGEGFKAVVERIKTSAQNAKAFYVIKTLEYLKKGGRIGKVEGTVGDLLNIKPIISVNEEGVYFTYKKIRGRKKSIQELVEIVKERATKPLRIGILHGDAEPEAKEMHGLIQQMNEVKEIFFSQISPVLTVHTGPGLLGVIVQELS